MLKGLFVGLWRAVSSPGMVLCLWLVNVAVTLPAAVIMFDSLESSIGSSLVHEELASGFDMDWYGEFQQGSGGLEATFTPTVVGAGAFYNNIEGWLYGGLFEWFRSPFCLVRPARRRSQSPSRIFLTFLASLDHLPRHALFRADTSSIGTIRCEGGGRRWRARRHADIAHS